MYEVKPTSKFKKDVRLMAKRGYNISLLESVVMKLANGEPLSEELKDHALVGNFKGFRECHITPDWLLIYQVKEDVLVLILTRAGSHSDLFKK